MENINNKKPPFTSNQPERTHSNPQTHTSPIKLVIANSNHLDLAQINTESILSSDEIAILNRRKHHSAKKEYLASRYLIKQLITQYQNVELRCLNTLFDAQEAALKVMHQGSTLPYSCVISHSKGWVAVYLSDEPTRFGIDLEQISEKRPYLKLAKHFYHCDEVSKIESSDVMSDTFFRIWTLKEALAKALATPIAQLLAVNAFERYHKEHIKAFSCRLNAFDFSLATPASEIPPALIEVELNNDLTGFKQTAVNCLHHVI